MSKGFSSLFKGTRGSFISLKTSPTNGKDYNIEKSIDVGIVNEINTRIDHGSSIKGIPNSVTIKKNKKGFVITERYYDKDGNAYLDIDYTNHGNSKGHPIVPHQHRMTIIGNKIIREKGVQIRK